MNSSNNPRIKIKPKSKTDQWEEVLQLISWWDAEKMATARVMVVGAGALGNEVIKNLALLNIGHIFIIDFDRIEYSNLSRSILFRPEDCDQLKAEVAAKRVKEINPNVKVQYSIGDVIYDLGLGVISRMDVVIGCLDNRVARLYINRHCYKVNKTWVDGGLLNLAGQLNVYKPYVSCYECGLEGKEMDSIRKRLSCSDVALRNSNYGKIPTTPISASVIGAMQVQEALKVIYGNEQNSLAGKRFWYEGMNNEFIIYKSSPFSSSNTECRSHTTIANVYKSKLSADNTISEALNWLKEKFQDQNVKILLDYDIILEVVTRISEVSYEMILPQHKLSDKKIREMEVEPLEGVAIPREKVIKNLDFSFPAPDMTLNEVGIPPLQILEVEVKDDIHFVELTGDESFLNFQ